MDIIGKVVKLPVFDANSSIPKLRLELRNGNYEQTVYLLGEHASLHLRPDDVVCFANLKVNEYRNVRSLQTAYLTLIEINLVTLCFHRTVKLVIRTLFNCTDCPELCMDSIAARETPGIFGHVRAFMMFVEPQMRKALHCYSRSEPIIIS